jgi:hypothetical protein
VSDPVSDWLCSRCEINNQHALAKALRDRKTAKDWKDCVNTNSDRRSPKADKSSRKRKPNDKKDKGNTCDKKYKAQASKIEQQKQQHTDLLARLEKGITMQPATPLTAPAFGASSVPGIHRSAASVSLRVCL